jgi:prevent-host-death family protein
MQRKIPAGVFKAQCLALLDDVHDSHTEIIVTKRGKPVARVVPVEESKPYKSSFGHMRGTVIQHCSDEELFSTGEVWEADSDG